MDTMKVADSFIDAYLPSTPGIGRHIVREKLAKVLQVVYLRGHRAGTKEAGISPIEVCEDCQEISHDEDCKRA